MKQEVTVKPSIHPASWKRAQTGVCTAARAGSGSVVRQWAVGKHGAAHPSTRRDVPHLEEEGDSDPGCTVDELEDVLVKKLSQQPPDSTPGRPGRAGLETVDWGLPGWGEWGEPHMVTERLSGGEGVWGVGGGGGRTASCGSLVPLCHTPENG